MAIWAVGDVQGCYDELAALLDKIKFDPAVDQLWLVGDLVNRGGQSLEVLRLLHQLDRSVTCVLGNHDLHLLASYVGHNPKGRSNPEFARVFAAPDGDELVRWLRFRPLMYVDDRNGYVLVHAGIAPYWDITTARHCAHEVEHVLRSPRYAKFLQKMYGATPTRWKPGQTGVAALAHHHEQLHANAVRRQQGQSQFPSLRCAGQPARQMAAMVCCPQPSRLATHHLCLVTGRRWGTTLVMV